MMHKKNKIRNAMTGVALFIIGILGNHCTLQAQNPILLECMNINKAYRASSYLSFNVRYTYALDSTTIIIKDSSHATYKMNGYRYWGSIDSVEFMQNDSFQIALYKPEQVISVGLPAYNYAQTLPMAQWDSLFFRNSKFTYTMTADSGFKKITVNYDSDMPVKKFEMWYDSVNYRIQRIRYKMDEATSDEEYENSGTLSGKVAIVDVFFSNYQTGTFTDDVFNSANYIYKSGSSYQPIALYEAYEVFIVSPELK
jgi:hypothetical protein